MRIYKIHSHGTVERISRKTGEMIFGENGSV
jgi:hypothetical protein